MFPLLLLLYGLSGAAALIYQVLWVRLLGLTFGVTVHAAATVLASFMTGLAIGTRRKYDVVTADAIIPTHSGRDRSSSVAAVHSSSMPARCS